MKIRKIILFLLFLLLSNTEILAQNIAVDDTYTAQQLVENVLVNSPCATVSNFLVNGDTFSAGQESYGYFSYSGTDFPFANGIVLSTSRANRTAGPNDNLIDEGSILWQGDATLEQALGITGTFNATSLEFDFTPLTSQISFDYIFASEEYQGTAPCRYSDGFAFLLKVAGSSDNYQNLALIPATTTPVKVTSVHPIITGTNGCSAQNEEYFGSYNSSVHPINFNGQTVVMTAHAAVTPGLTYHIKLVIADEENIRYDSAIFLAGSSFDVGTDLGEDRLNDTNNPVCEGQNVILDATEPGINTYTWFKDGFIIPGETTATYTVTSQGFYEVEVTINGTTCVANGEINIEYSNIPTLFDQTLIQCDDDNDGVTTYNLSQLDSLITGGNSQISNPIYYESLANAQADNNPILNPSNYLNNSTNQLFAKAQNTYGCSSYATINLEIPNNSISAINPIFICDSDDTQDGITIFDLDTLVSNPLLSSLPSGLTLAYYLSENDAIASNYPININYTTTTPYLETIYVKILDGINCYGILPIELNVNTFDPPNFEDSILYLCNLSPINLEIATGFSSYNWTNGDNDNSTTITVPGIYLVTVTDANGCEKTKRFEVLASGIATITSINVIDFNGLNNSAEVILSGLGDYEYSIDGVNYQANSVFTSLFPAEYIIYVKDIHFCGIVQQSFIILDYPRYFTPNGDGINDFWKIENLINLSNSKLSIFDRFGKLIISYTEYSQGWNGTLNELELPSTDYWFVLTLNNGKTIKGNFSLKR
ncbi:choice-of-anchor L domain-containing protein [Flavobacterium sp.]|uniref:T9SS type B sorting domain-containing protein n=1 Tax=Flavobacterium sp. TaxID=239 RepID=UPI003753B16D